MKDSRYVKTKVVHGLELEEFPKGNARFGGDEGALYMLEGKEQSLEFDDTGVLQKHILVIGATGTGKTNGIFQLVKEIKSKMTEKDTMIIFDTKGDYLKEFYEEKRGDVAISVGKEGKYNYETWNLFEDVKFDSEFTQKTTIFEIISTLFDDAIRKSQNPFFPQAARDIAVAITLNLLRERENMSNEDLRKVIFEGGLPKIMEILKKYPDTVWANEYVSVGGPQAQGVYGELVGTLYPILNGPFGEKGTFSIRNFVRQPKKRAVFFVFGINTSKALTPAYKIMYDLAIKEVLTRKAKGGGRTFFVIDEFSLLPNLNYIENGLNFGRGLGARFIISTQNVNQVIDAYNQFRGMSILSGFGTVIAFKLFDKPSRDFVSQRYGRHIKNIKVRDSSEYEGSERKNYVEGNVIEDWHISGLKSWEAIICLPRLNPGKFTFAEYKSRRKE